MVLIRSICLIFCSTMDKVQTFKLMLLEEDWKCFFNKIYSLMKINHVKQTVNCFSETLPLFCIFPIWRTFHASQKFVNELLKHCAYIESSENITSEILFRKGKFKEEATKDSHKYKNTKNSFEHPSNIGSSIKKLVEISFVNDCFCRSLKIYQGWGCWLILISPCWFEVLCLYTFSCRSFLPRE